MLRTFFENFLVKYGEDYFIRTKSLTTFFRHKYEMRIPVHTFLECGLNQALVFFEQTRQRFQSLFNLYDTSNDGAINFEELKVMVMNLNPNIPNWKIHALYSDTTHSSKFEAPINFDQFVSACMNNPILDGIMDLELN
jgi:Ca2+-binding EF-hand superfamily protein